MFGPRFFGARFFGPRYFGAGGISGGSTSRRALYLRGKSFWRGGS
jgi:hypothetical protein